jgi:hypothetical protein
MPSWSPGTGAPLDMGVPSSEITSYVNPDGRSTRPFGSGTSSPKLAPGLLAGALAAPSAADASSAAAAPPNPRNSRRLARRRSQLPWMDMRYLLDRTVSRPTVGRLGWAMGVGVVNDL